MRLLFTTTDHTNTNLTDSRGNVHYTITTPRAPKKVTTITRYRWSSPCGVPETMAVIEWHRLKETTMRFDGETIPANALLRTRGWTTGRYFTAPDGQTYKWKFASTHCWMKRAGEDAELVRFHRKNLGILKQAHPAYLDVSPQVVPVLDHVVLTFVYVESLRQAHEAGQPFNGIHSRNVVKTITTMNATT